MPCLARLQFDTRDRNLDTLDILGSAISSTMLHGLLGGQDHAPSSAFMCSGSTGPPRTNTSPPPPAARSPNSTLPTSHSTLNSHASSLTGAAGLTCEPPPLGTLDDEGRMLVWKMALKAADLGHLASPPPVHLRWVGLLEEEFFRQGDRERALGLPPSPLMDRGQGGISHGQPVSGLPHKVTSQRATLWCP